MHASLPTRLRVLRAQHGLHLTEAARKLGIGRDTLSDLERGVRRPAFPTLKKISEGYGVPVEELLAAEEPAVAGKAEALEARALSLSSEEFSDWIKEAELTELHALFSRPRGDVTDPVEGAVLADRKQAAIDEFFSRVPIEQITVYESMLPKERERQTGEAS